jgi:ribonuclease HI
LIRISENSVYKWTFNCGTGTNTRAELLGAWATHILVVRLNIASIQVIGDSKIIIDWLKDKGKLQVASLWGGRTGSSSSKNLLGRSDTHMFELWMQPQLLLP